VSEELKQRLKALEEELERVDHLEDDERAMLQEVSADIHRALGDEVTEDDLLDRARSALEAFEARHPALTEAVNRVATMLHELGL